MEVSPSKSKKKVKEKLKNGVSEEDVQLDKIVGKAKEREYLYKEMANSYINSRITYTYGLIYFWFLKTAQLLSKYMECDESGDSLGGTIENLRENLKPGICLICIEDVENGDAVCRISDD